MRNKLKILLRERLLSETVKPGVHELFNSNTELANIGTPQQYSQYIGTVFPNSKMKDVFYHGTRFEGTIEKFNTEVNGKYGTYFTTNLEVTSQYKNRKGKLYSVMLNVTKPYVSKRTFLSRLGIKTKDNPLNIKSDRIFEKEHETLVKNGYDSITDGESEIAVFNSNQIYILGSTQDIEQFKTFIGNTKNH